MRGFFRSQLSLMITAAGIVTWLAMFPSLLSLWTTRELNQAVSVRSDSEIVAIIRIDQSATYDCALVFEPDGSLIDEAMREYKKLVTHELPPAPTILDLTVRCSVYGRDQPDVFQTESSHALEDVVSMPSISLTRIHVNTYASGFALEPGVYVVRANVQGNPSALQRLNLAARVDLVQSTRQINSRFNHSLFQFGVATVVNMLLSVYLAALGVALAWRVIVAMLGPIVRQTVTKALSGFQTVKVFRELPSGKQKLLIALPMVIASFTCLYLPWAQGYIAFAGVALVLSLAILLVGLVENQWSAPLSRWSRSYAELHPFVRGLLAVVIVSGAIGFAVFTVRALA